MILRPGVKKGEAREKERKVNELKVTGRRVSKIIMR